MNRTRTTTLSTILLIAGLALFSGCNGKEAPDRRGDTAEPAAPSLPAGLFVSTAPEGAVPVTTLKQTAKQGDEVVMRVVIGGRIKPFVPNRAIVLVTDASVQNPCVSDDDHCKTPWDYCCTPAEERTANGATVQITDEKGAPLALDVSGRDELKPLNALVVKGIVGPRPDPSVLIVSATSIHVEASK